MSREYRDMTLDEKEIEEDLAGHHIAALFTTAVWEAQRVELQLPNLLRLLIMVYSSQEIKEARKTKEVREFVCAQKEKRKSP